MARARKASLEDLPTDRSCPHADDRSLCRRMVAAALLWRAYLGGEGDRPLP